MHQITKGLIANMENTLKVLDNELKGLRTGRASVNLLDPVVVEVYGSKMPISQVASISVSDSKTLMVQVWDKSNVKAVEKAISDANLGLTASSEGQNLRIPLPPLSEQRRQELVKIAHKYGENTKIAVRNVRRSGMDELKKIEKTMSKDDFHNISEEIQKATDDFIVKVDKAVKTKETEILTI